MKVKKKYFLIATFIIVCAVLIVLYAGFFIAGHGPEYDGTLVKAYQWRFL